MNVSCHCLMALHGLVLCLCVFLVRKRLTAVSDSEKRRERKRFYPLHGERKEVWNRSSCCGHEERLLCSEEDCFVNKRFSVYQVSDGDDDEDDNEDDDVMVSFPMERQKET